MAIYLPEDDAIPAPAVPAEDGQRELTADKRLLQREARTDNVALQRAAYALLAAIAAAWLATISWGLRRLGRGSAAPVDLGHRDRQPDLTPR